jgi:hypothetical protein
MNQPQKRTIYAEDLPYWRTSKSTLSSWLNKAKREITSINGKVTGDGYMTDHENGRGAILITFVLDGTRYAAKWPVLPTRRKTEQDEEAAKVQAATALYHDIKNRVVSAKFRGAGFSFLNYQVLQTGQTVSEVADNGFVNRLPMLLQPPREET